MDTAYLEDLKAAVEDTLQSTAHVVQTCRAAYRQAQERLEKVHEEVTQEKKQLEIALSVERERIAAVRHCLLAHMQELTAVQGAKHDLCSSPDLLINHLDVDRENLQLKDRLSRVEVEMQEEQEAWRAEKEEMMSSEELMEDTSRSMASMEVKDPLINHLDLERENLQLKDRLSRLEMEMQEEREAWRAQKREILRRAEELMEDTSRNMASMGVKDPLINHLDLERENLQLKDRLSRLEAAMQVEREAWRAEKEQTTRITQEFVQFICSHCSTLEQKVRELERERDNGIEERGDEKGVKERKKEQKKKEKELRKQRKEEEKRVRNLEREREKERKAEEKERKEEERRKEKELRKQRKEEEKRKELQEERSSGMRSFWRRLCRRK